MAIIKQLKTFLSKTKIYPKTLTKAVYNDDGTSLHEVVKNALYADDDEEEIVDADPRDADTLGGKYTADILDTTFQMAQQFMTSIDIYKLNWGAVTDENIGGVDYKVMWPIAPDGTNDVYGLLITTNGQLGLIRNNKGSKSTSITNYNANTIAGWVTGSSATQTKTVSYSNYSERAGTVVLLNWYNANTYKGLVKMNINSQGAKDLYLNGQITSATNYDIPKGVYVTYFDGTKYYMRTDGKLPIPEIEQMKKDIADMTTVEFDRANVGSLVVEYLIYGKLCSLSFRAGSVSASADNVIGTLPENIRPDQLVDYVDTYSSARLLIAANGEVTTKKALNNAPVRGTVNYILKR